MAVTGPGIVWAIAAMSDSVDQRRQPRHGEVQGATVAPLGAGQGGDHRASCHQAHGGDGNPAEPGDAGADAFATEPTADGDQPTERFSDRDRQRSGGGAAGQDHIPVRAPAERRPADGLEPVGQLVAGLRRSAGPGRPHHDQALGPRRLQADLAGRISGSDGGDGVVGLEEQVVRGIELGQLGLEVGDDLGPLGAGKVPRGVEAVLGVVEEVLEDVAPPVPVGLEQVELFWRGAAFGGRPCGRDERFGEVRHRLSGAPCACAPPTGRSGSHEDVGPESHRARATLGPPAAILGCLFTDTTAMRRGFVSAISPDGPVLPSGRDVDRGVQPMETRNVFRWVPVLLTLYPRSLRQAAPATVRTPRWRVGERGDLRLSECPTDACSRVHGVEPVERAVHDVEVAVHAGGSQPLRVLDPFIVEQVLGTDPDPGGREVGEILPTGRDGQRVPIGPTGIGAQVRTPPEPVGSQVPHAEVPLVDVGAGRRAVVEHRIDEQLERRVDLLPLDRQGGQRRREAAPCAGSRDRNSFRVDLRT